MSSGLRISSGSVTDRGLSEKRPQNEDSYLEIRERGIFAVADGVGGAQAGEVASQMAMEILAEAFTNFPVGADAESVMRAAIERSNTAIFQMAYELPQLANMATTIVAMHLDGNIATIGHVGDSRLYRVDRAGNLYRDTDDHSMVADEVRAGRMTQEQADSHPSRNVISRALGAEPTVEPDLKTIMVEPGTSFLVCSDGITRHVGDQEIKGVLTFGGEPHEICEYLKDLCFQRGAEDNLTAVVVKVAVEQTAVNGKPADQPVVPGEEQTVATARISHEDSQDSDLEPKLPDMDTGQLPPISPPATDPFLEPPTSAAEPEPDNTSEMLDKPIVPVPVVREAELEVREEPDETVIRTSSVNIMGTLGALVFGTLLGLGMYHFLWAPSAGPVVPALTEMQSGNQQLSAFEENRRTVDRSPAEALARFATDPRDAEDFFLVGRAQLLLAQYPEAKRSFTEARTKIAGGDVDANNARTIETEIAIAMAVLNDTTVQAILRSQLTPGEPIPMPPSSSPTP